MTGLKPHSDIYVHDISVHSLGHQREIHFSIIFRVINTSVEAPIYSTTFSIISKHLKFDSSVDMNWLISLCFCFSLTKCSFDTCCCVDCGALGGDGRGTSEAGERRRLHVCRTLPYRPRAAATDSLRKLRVRNALAGTVHRKRTNTNTVFFFLISATLFMKSITSMFEDLWKFWYSCADWLIRYHLYISLPKDMSVILERNGLNVSQSGDCWQAQMVSYTGNPFMYGKAANQTVSVAHASTKLICRVPVWRSSTSQFDECNLFHWPGADPEFS